MGILKLVYNFEIKSDRQILFALIVLNSLKNTYLNTNRFSLTQKIQNSSFNHNSDITTKVSPKKHFLIKPLT